MKQINVQDSCITIINPSQLVLDANDFFRMSQELPSQNNLLQKKEGELYEYLGDRKKMTFNNVLFFTIDLNKVETTVNTVFEDGVDLDDELTTVRSPYDRTIRRKASDLDSPTRQPELDKSQITSIIIGNYMTIATQPIIINRQSIPLLALSSDYEIETEIGIKTR